MQSAHITSRFIGSSRHLYHRAPKEHERSGTLPRHMPAAVMSFDPSKSLISCQGWPSYRVLFWGQGMACLDGTSIALLLIVTSLTPRRIEWRGKLVLRHVMVRNTGARAFPKHPDQSQILMRRREGMLLHQLQVRKPCPQRLMQSRTNRKTLNQYTESVELESRVSIKERWNPVPEGPGHL